VKVCTLAAGACCIAAPYLRQIAAKRSSCDASESRKLFTSKQCDFSLRSSALRTASYSPVPFLG
jgi:hypothetical protein